MPEPTLHENLDLLSDTDLESKLQDLSKKYWLAHRLGKPELLTQLQNYIIFYKEELHNRYRKKIQTNFDSSLDDLINVDK